MAVRRLRLNEYEADELLLDILRELNCNEAVRYFYKIQKAY